MLEQLLFGALGRQFGAFEVFVDLIEQAPTSIPESVIFKIVIRPVHVFLPKQ